MDLIVNLELNYRDVARIDNVRQLTNLFDQILQMTQPT